jgi:hypothetical protein
LDKALAVHRQVLGEEHRHTATSYNNVAGNLRAQRKHAQAEPLYRKALAIRRKVLGEGHPATALSYNSVASNLYAQGKHAQAVGPALRATGSFEVARLAGGSAGLDRALFAAAHGSPYPLPAVLHARLGRSTDAWQALEAYLGRGLVEALGARQPPLLTADECQRQEQLRRQLAELAPQVLALVRQRDTSDADRQWLQTLLRERSRLESELADLAVRVARRDLTELAALQEQMPPDAALLAWVDVQGAGGRCRSTGPVRSRRQGRSCGSGFPAVDATTPGSRTTTHCPGACASP